MYNRASVKCTLVYGEYAYVKKEVEAAVASQTWLHSRPEACRSSSRLTTTERVISGSVEDCSFDAAGGGGDGGWNDVVLRLNLRDRLANETSPASFWGRFNGGMLGHSNKRGVDEADDDI